MRKIVYIVIAAMVLLMINPLTGDAGPRGHGGHRGGHTRVGVGVWIGPGWWGPHYYPYYPYYPYRPYYEPPPVVIQQPPVYIQQEPQREEESYWYFCTDSKSYYPYVKECPGGWMKVVPSAPPDEGKKYVPPSGGTQQQSSSQKEQGYWYFCTDSKSYYPYVKECPGGWMKVVPSVPDEGKSQPKQDSPDQRW